VRHSILLLLRGEVAAIKTVSFPVKRGGKGAKTSKRELEGGDSATRQPRKENQGPAHVRVSVTARDGGRAMR
jgi:hypothetical protein